MSELVLIYNASKDSQRKKFGLSNLYPRYVFAELYKRERERLVHWATHERGSLLAHIFPKVLVHEREWTWLTFFLSSHSF